MPGVAGCTTTVTALQRRADVIVQKSLAEGFGLTVAEAMWKAPQSWPAASAASRTKITHDRNGLLLDDPSDLVAFGRATATLLEEHERAARLGREAHRSVRHHYLVPRRLTQELDLIQRLNSPVARRPSEGPRAGASCRAEGPIASSSPPIAVIDGDGREGSRSLAPLSGLRWPSYQDPPGSRVLLGGSWPSWACRQTR